MLLFFSQIKLTLLNHQKSLQLNFIILVLFSYGLLINSLFLVDSTSDLPSYYFATILHLGALFKSQHPYQSQLAMWRVMAQSCAKNCVPSIIQNLYTPKHFIYILVSATCARHVLACMLNSDIRSSVEPTIAFTPII